jgi:hypothetical protein
MNLILDVDLLYSFGWVRHEMSSFGWVSRGMSDAVEKASDVHSTHALGPHCMSKEVICTYARRGRLSRGQCFILKGALVP